jgi:hypothetical protein
MTKHFAFVIGLLKRTDANFSRQTCLCLVFSWSRVPLVFMLILAFLDIETSVRPSYIKKMTEQQTMCTLFQWIPYLANK